MTDEWGIVFSEDPIEALGVALRESGAPASLRAKLCDLKGRARSAADLATIRLTVLAVLRNARLGRSLEAELALDHALAGAPVPDALMPPPLATAQSAQDARLGPLLTRAAEVLIRVQRLQTDLTASMTGLGRTLQRLESALQQRADRGPPAAVPSPSLLVDDDE